MSGDDPFGSDDRKYEIRHPSTGMLLGQANSQSEADAAVDAINNQRLRDDADRAAKAIPPTQPPVVSSVVFTPANKDPGRRPPGVTTGSYGHPVLKFLFGAIIVVAIICGGIYGVGYYLHEKVVADAKPIAASALAGTWSNADGRKYRFVKTSGTSYRGELVGQSKCRPENIKVKRVGNGYYTGTEALYGGKCGHITGTASVTIRIYNSGRTAYFQSSSSSACPGCGTQVWQHSH